MLENVLAKLREVKGPDARGWYSARCPFHNDQGRRNLGVTQDGFNCLRCGAHGSLAELAQYVGANHEKWRANKRRRLAEGEAMEKLKERGISAETAQHFGIELDVKKQAWAYPVMVGGTKVATRYKALDSGADVKYWTEPRGKGILIYNLDGAQGQEEIWLCEGEPDVWMLHEHGVSAVCFTGGATHVPGHAAQQLLQAGVRKINICYDQDTAGREGARRAAAVLASCFEVTIRTLPEQLGKKADITDLYQYEKEHFKEALLSLPSAEFEPPKTVFKWRELVQGDLVPVDWLVDELIPFRGVVVCGGDAGVGKSWFGQHVAQCVAAGKPVLGKFATSQGPVVYIEAESGERLLKRRVQKLAAGLEVPNDIPVTFLVNRQVRIDEEDSLDELLDIIKKEKPKLVIFDPLVRIHGADENVAREMADVMAKLREIQTRLGCTVIVTHHTRKRSMINLPGQMLRGSTDIRAAADVHLFIQRAGGSKQRRLIRHEKSRHCEPLDPFEIEIADNEAGTATFLRYVGPREAPKSKKEIAKELITQMVAEEGRMTRQQIIDRCRPQAGSRAVSDALKELLRDEVLELEVGARRQHTYSLAGTSQMVPQLHQGF